MAKRLIIHPGRHKTGTSSLQNYFNSLFPSDALHNWIYPRTGRELDGRPSIAHHALARNVHARFYDSHQLEKLRDELYEETAGYNVVLLSSEAFQNIPDTTLLKYLFGKFHFEEITVVAYVREYLSYAVSSFAQKAHNQQEFITFADYLKQNWRIGRFFELWSSFGRAIFRPYDRRLLKNGDIVDDFFDSLAMAPPSDARFDSNPSIGGNLLYFKLVANRAGIPFLDYPTLSRLASGYEPFRQPFRITASDAHRWRSASDYGRAVERHLGELPERSFSDHPALPALGTMQADFERCREFDAALSFERVRGLAGEARRWFAC